MKNHYTESLENLSKESLLNLQAEIKKRINEFIKTRIEIDKNIALLTAKLNTVNDTIKKIENKEETKTFETTFLGYDNIEYPAIMTIRKTGDNYACILYEYLDNGNWYDTHDSGNASQKEMAGLWKYGTLAHSDYDY